MKKTFVLDENVIIAASKGSTYAIDLLTSIARNCHSIAADPELLRRYWLRLRGAKVSPEVPKLVGQLTHHANKCCVVAESGADDRRIPIRHQKDVFLVSIARGCSPAPSLIVLTDKKTRDDINTKTEFEALTIGDALRQAQKS